MKGRNGRHKCVIGVKDTTWPPPPTEKERPNIDGVSIEEQQVDEAHTGKKKEIYI